MSGSIWTLIQWNTVIQDLYGKKNAGFLSKRESDGDTPPPMSTGEPKRKRKVQWAGDTSRKRQHPMIVSEGDTEQPNDQTRGDTPPDTDTETGQALNGSPGLSPNVIENELQLQRTQELARIPETSADGTNNEHSATPGSGDECGNIQRPRR
jgi:hypothetical protein